MKMEIAIDEHKGVGPAGSLYHHDEVVGLVPSGDEKGWELLACLDCGYTADDIKMFAHEPCERDSNEINSTFRERLPDGALPGDDGEYVPCDECGE